MFVFAFFVHFPIERLLVFNVCELTYVQDNYFCVHKHPCISVGEMKEGYANQGQEHIFVLRYSDVLFCRYFCYSYFQASHTQPSSASAWTLNLCHLQRTEDVLTLYG